ncbi:ATP-binding protein [Planococcus dechangensis]|uniref:AAA family ATPase n=1 Tax=Planococcus dechangensis TaxID=1176255 RepID=A0ABV9MG55_9BACL
MKLEKLIIYGFGRHENRTIELNAPITVFFGKNEAGKTTIQQFILQMLFGFSARSHAHKRYEPKAGGKYGGQLHVIDPEHGCVVVERTAGKSAGDVNVWFEDGRRGGEAELGELLRGYDRSSYEAIFSFSVHELQDLDAMTEQELTRTLLSSGTSGVDHAGKMESQLEREMSELFKKAGKLPLINRLSEELRQLEKELRDSKSRAESFLPATQRLQQIKLRLNELEQQERGLSQTMKQAEKWQQGAPLLERQKQLEPLAAAGTQDFPEGGVRQYERLLDQKNEVLAEAAFLQSELAHYGQVEEMPDTQALSLLLGREAEWHQLTSSLKLKREERNRLDDELDRLLKLCGMNHEQALSADVSLGQEEQLKKVLATVQAAEEEQAFQRRRLEEERQQMKAAEQELKRYLEAEPPEEQRQRAEQWGEIAPQLQLAKAERSKRSGTAANNRVALYLLVAIGTVGLIIALSTADLFAGALALMATGAALWLWLRDRKSSPSDDHELILRYAGQEAEYEALLARLSQYDKGLDERLDALETSKRKLASWPSDESDSAMVEYRRFIGSLGFSEETPRSTILTLFDKLRDAHAVKLRLGRINKELQELECEQQGWLVDAQAACGKPVSADGVMTALRTEWQMRQQRVQRLEKAREKRQQLEQQSRKCQERLDSLAHSARDLFKRAAVGDEDDFYRAATQAQQAAAAQEELKMVQSQLAAIGEVARPDGLDEQTGSITQFLENLQQALDHLADERKNLLEEQAAKQQQTKHLLSDDSHAIKLQQVEEKKTEFQEAAKEWAINKAIVEAFRQTMEELKETKLPAVLALSESYFERLTDGAYVRLALTPEGDFEAQRRDGLRFRVIELSQATKEQAYLALRFALASTLKDSHPFPILMDDPFVHFDRRRGTQVIKLVEELQTDHQFIYFTCHEAMLDAWPEAQQIDVANPERSIQA